MSEEKIKIFTISTTCEEIKSSTQLACRLADRVKELINDKENFEIVKSVSCLMDNSTEGKTKVSFRFECNVTNKDVEVDFFSACIIDVLEQVI